MGILLFSSYFGFAQTADIRIIQTNSSVIYNNYELQYRKTSDNSEGAWVTIESITPQQLDAGNGNFYTPYTLNNLECATQYQVRVRAYLEDEFGGRIYGTWGYVQFTTPDAYTGGPWSWQIGPFDVYCPLFTLRPNYMSVFNPKIEEIFVAENHKTTKDAIKEE